jgi:DNA polymerase III subunit gamma/tau
MLKPFSKRNKKIIDGVVKNKNIANGYLFSGVSGSFILGAAQYFSMSVNCLNFNEGPCGVCAVCLAFQKGVFADYVVVNPGEGQGKSDSITVDQIRNIQEIVKYGANTPGRMFVVINNSHKLTKQASNAFLKTLEEPAERVSFILLTRNLMDVMPTIKSRCQSMYYPCATKDEMIAYIKKHYKDNEFNEIVERAVGSKELLGRFLETSKIVGVNYISFKDLLNSSKIDRLIFVEKLAKDKNEAQMLLMIWIDELMQAYGDLDWQVINNIELLIENVVQMKYNVNLRLHLESLMLNLV